MPREHGTEAAIYLGDETIQICQTFAPERGTGKGRRDEARNHSSNCCMSG